jgi:hypothetical protein
MQFDEASLHTLATKAILDSMTPEHREQLLARAVAGLFEPNKQGGYPPDKRTKFEAAFDDALDYSCRQIVRELVAQPQYVDAIKPLLAKAVEKALVGENAERLVTVFENAITEGLSKLRGY